MGAHHREFLPVKMLAYKLHQFAEESHDREEFIAALDKHFRKDASYTTVWDMPDGKEWPYLSLGGQSLLVDERDVKDNIWIRLPEKLWGSWGL